MYTVRLLSRLLRRGCAPKSTCFVIFCGSLPGKEGDRITEERREHMIRLRPYKPSDAWSLLEWWKDADEEAFIKWSCNKFEYPLSIEQLDGYFSLWCLREDSGWLMTALDERGKPVGHFLMRLADYETGTIRMGFIVVDPRARGRGCGKEMMRQALWYAFRILGMKKVTLGVFKNNPQAKACYETVGFTETAFVAEYVNYDGVVYDGYEMEAVDHG